MTSTRKGTAGDFEICHVFADSIVLNNRSIVYFCGFKGGGVECHKIGLFVDVTNV